MLFRRKKKVTIEVISKFHLYDFVDFYYKDDVYFGRISNVYLAPSGEVLYDIDIAGQCPATLTKISESKIIRIHGRK